MKIYELHRVLSGKFRLRYIDHFSGKEIPYRSMSRRDQRIFRESVIYMVFPGKVKNELEVIVYYQGEDLE